MKTTSISPKAEAAYIATHAEAAILLDQIKGLLGDLPSPDSERIHYGHVGSMSEAVFRLASVAAFLAEVSNSIKADADE